MIRPIATMPHADSEYFQIFHRHAAAPTDLILLHLILSCECGLGSCHGADDLHHVRHENGTAYMDDVWHSEYVVPGGISHQRPVALPYRMEASAV